jgi:ATP-binding cassette subfamily B (MDR/TAP) protein 1
VQVGKCIQLTSTFVGGFTIAFVQGWLLTIVLCSAIPLLVMAGASVAMIISKMASRGQSAYASASIIVEQTIGAIKTVSQFCQNQIHLRKNFGFLLDTVNPIFLFIL